mgnify:CR=1 FL=1
MIKQLIFKIIRWFKDDNNMFFIGSTDKLPPPLSKSEEIFYVTKSMEGDEYARSKLIEHNLRLVAHIVKKYSDKMDNVDDLISIGTIGLIKGIDSFSKSNGAKITTYCARCIENAHLT